ncbi:MAG: DNRLRE domain-containing protein [Minisyncoccota bacterium]
MRKLFAVLLFCLSFAVHADQVLFQPGFSQGKDMWLSSSYNQTAVDDDKLQVGGWGDWYRTFIQFDLSGLPQTATSATMWMYAVPRGDSSTPVSMNAYLLTTAWNEQTQNYYTTLYAYALGTIPAPTPNSWYGLTITGIYNGWKNGTYVNDGFVFLPTGNNNQFNVFRSSDYSDPFHRPMLVVTYDGANLAFPLQGIIPAGQPTAGMQYAPYTAPISAVLDHQVTPAGTGFNCADGVVVAYTGEIGKAPYGKSQGTVDPIPSCPNELLYGFKNSTGTAFSINGQYSSTDLNGVDPNLFLFYDGHTGYDYPVPYGTPVYAAADGTATCDSSSNVGLGIKITHLSGYDTYYLHLSSRVAIPSCQGNQGVTKGMLIGYTGNANHLHFTVKKRGVGQNPDQRVDPYGWKGEWNTDPLKVDGKDNVCLWETCRW